MAKGKNQLAVISDYLRTKTDRIQATLPKGASVNAGDLIRFLLMSLKDTPELLACTAESIYLAVLDAARMNVELGGPMAEAYVVPYKGKAQFQLGFRGLLKLVRNSGAVKDVNVEFVYEGDTFERKLGLLGEFTHIADRSKDREQKPITHVYSEFLLQDGTIKRHVMTRGEIEYIAQRFSESYRSGKASSPWKTSWRAMASKTVLRQPIMRGLLPIKLTEDQQRIVAETSDEPGLGIEDTAKLLDHVTPDETVDLPPEPDKIESPGTMHALERQLRSCQTAEEVEAAREAAAAITKYETEWEEINMLCDGRLQALGLEVHKQSK